MVYPDRYILLYPFIPVRVTPWMKYLCAKKKRAITGSVMRVEAAMSMPKSVLCSPRKSNRPRARG